MAVEGGLLVDSSWTSLGVREKPAKAQELENQLCDLKKTRNVEGLRSQAISISFVELMFPDWYRSIQKTSRGYRRLLETYHEGNTMVSGRDETLSGGKCGDLWLAATLMCLFGHVIRAAPGKLHCDGRALAAL